MLGDSGTNFARERTEVSVMNKNMSYKPYKLGKRNGRRWFELRSTADIFASLVCSRSHLYYMEEGLSSRSSLAGLQVRCEKMASWSDALANERHCILVNGLILISPIFAAQAMVVDFDVSCRASSTSLVVG